MPSVIETAINSARATHEEGTVVTAEVATRVLDEEWPGEDMLRRDLVDLPFDAGVVDAFGSGWPARFERR